MPMQFIKQLTEQDISDIVELERASFISPLQASTAAIAERLHRHHQMYGIYQESELVSMIALFFRDMDPENIETYPATLDALVNSTHDPVGNTAFIYNMEVKPAYRGGRYVKSMIHMALDIAKAGGCDYGIANCRITAYGGADPAYSQEKTHHNVEFQTAIDRYLDGGVFPSQEEFMLDPYLALVRRMSGCDFQWILQNFGPKDKATQGIRALAFGELKHHPVGKK